MVKFFNTNALEINIYIIVFVIYNNMELLDLHLKITNKKK